MLLSRLIAIGFWGSIFAMLRFGKYCRLLNGGPGMDPQDAEHYQAKARGWLMAAGGLLGLSVLSVMIGIILQ